MPGPFEHQICLQRPNADVSGSPIFVLGTVDQMTPSGGGLSEDEASIEQLKDRIGEMEQTNEILPLVHDD